MGGVHGAFWGRKRDEACRKKVIIEGNPVEEWRRAAFEGKRSKKGAGTKLEPKEFFGEVR